MKRLGLSIMLVVLIFPLLAIPQTINYQGKLTDLSGIGENDTLDIRFRVFDVETGGDSLWAMTIADVPIVHGMFDVNIGPIDLPFDEQYWLEIMVDGEVLAPRVQLTSSPYSFRAAVADSFTGGVPPWTQDTMVSHWDSLRNVPAGFADGIDNIGGSDNDWTVTTAIGDGVNDTVLVTGGHWGLFREGNVGRGDDCSTHVNLGVACTTGTSAGSVYYITVSGGYGHIASSYCATISGGGANEARGNYSTIGGGSANKADYNYSTVAGGAGNNASEFASAIAGGFYNSTNGQYSAVGGGYFNAVSGKNSVIPGGYANVDSADYSFVFGDSNLVRETADYSVLFGIKDTIGMDSTFVIGLPYTNITGTATIESLIIKGSYSFPKNDGDENFVLKTDGAGNLSWQEDNSGDSDGDWTVSGSNMYSAVSGNVGVGLTAPDAKFQVCGDFEVVTGDCYIYVTDGSYVEGSATPRLPCDVSSGADCADTVITTTDLGPVAYDYFYFGYGFISYVYNKTATIHPAIMRVDTTAGTVEINADVDITGTTNISGNVGIGTTTPHSRLHVEAYDDTVGVDDGVFISVSNTCDDSSAISGIRFKTRGTTDSLFHKGAIAFQRTTPQGRGNILFLNNNRANNTNADISDVKMTITPAGDVGIGTTTPNAKVEIASNSSSTTPTLLLHETDADAARIRFTNDDTTTYFTISAKPADTPETSRYTTYFYTTPIISFMGDGNVGIGTTTPTEKLFVTGNVQASGYIITDTISSPLDTLYIPAKVWMDELVTDSIEARSDVVKIRDALSIRDSLYFDGEWRKEWPVSPTTYSVGDFAHGGVVFWVDETGQHGLVCAKEDQTPNRWYAGTNTYTMARGDGPFAGEMNTAIIIANQGYGDGANYAARVCNELQITEGGKTYSDWYLPSNEELMLMCINQVIINSTALANGGSAFEIWEYPQYWSSTEVNDSEAKAIDMPTGAPLELDKWHIHRMRAVRRF